MGGNISAKEYLMQAQSIKMRLEAMAEQLAFLKSATQYLSPQYSDMPKTSTKNIHKNEDAIVRVLEYEEKMRKYHAKLNEINEAIDSVSNPTAQAILAKRYLGRNIWDEIAQLLYISRSRVFELHNAALIEIENTILNRTVSDE